MRAAMSCCLAVLLIGCGQSGEKPADNDVGASPAVAEEPAGNALADMAGTWNIRSKVEGSDRTLTYDIVATGDESGWTINFPGRDPIPARVVTTDGDSLVLEAGPFESALRKGVTVKQSRVVARLQGDKLTGTTTAVYDVSGADTVTTLTLEGTRAP